MHDSHFEEEVSKYVPAGHVVKQLGEARGLYVPVVQGKHTADEKVMPTRGLYLPAAHATHAEDPDADVPAGHVENVNTQEEAPSTLNAPAAQLVQLAAPAAALKVPAEQAMHWP